MGEIQTGQEQAGKQNGGRPASLAANRPQADGAPRGALTVMWERYVVCDQSKRPALRRELIEAYAPLARYVVDRMNIKPGPALGPDDLLSQALVGLIDAVDRFDPGRGIKFETYAYHRIRGSVMDMLRDMDWLPRSVRQRESDLTLGLLPPSGASGCPPSDEQLAEALGITVSELDDTAHGLALQSMQSLDEVVSGQSRDAQGWDDATLGDSVADKSVLLPEDHVESQAERDLLAKAIQVLPDSERAVISLYYHEGLALKEIGKVLGVTESRVCQIHGKALLRLRAHIAPLLALPAS